MCGGVGCMTGESNKCSHMAVGGNQGLEIESPELRELLEDDD